MVRLLSCQRLPHVNELLAADDFDLLNGRGGGGLHAQEEGRAGWLAYPRFRNRQ
jgi:hypothetical protein